MKIPLEHSFETSRQISFPIPTEYGNLTIKLEIKMISGDQNRTEFCVEIRANNYCSLPKGTKLLIYGSRDDGSLPISFIGNIVAKNHKDGDQIEDEFRFDDKITDGKNSCLKLKSFLSEENQGINTENPEKFEIIIAIPQENSQNGSQDNSYLIAHSTGDDLIESFENYQKTEKAKSRNHEVNSESTNLWGKLISLVVSFVRK